jgi:hypothetical protein
MEETMHKFLSVIKHFQTPSISKGDFEETAIGLATWFPLKTHIGRETLTSPHFFRPNIRPSATTPPRKLHTPMLSP